MGRSWALDLDRVSINALTWGLAPAIGLEPITCRLTAGCSAN